MKPMLAATLKSLSDAPLPALVTPKLDGIRCLRVGDQALSRNFKPIANAHIRGLVERLPEGLDGELVAPGGFQSTQSAVMSYGGRPDFEYHVFDIVGPEGYRERVARLFSLDLPSFVRFVLPRVASDLAGLERLEDDCLSQGYEGIMLRTPDSPYKFGRSSLREGWLLKFKRFRDGEAVIVGWKEERTNLNPQVVDELGRNRRPGGQALSFPKGTLGALIVRDGDVEFDVGGGFTAEQRRVLWLVKETLVGRVVHYRCQDVGAKDRPRFPRFCGFREDLE